MPLATSPSVPQKRKQAPVRNTASPAKKPATPSSNTKTRPNGSILSFFKKSQASYDGPKSQGDVDPQFFLADEDESELQDTLYSSPTKSDRIIVNVHESPPKDEGNEQVQAVVDAIDVDPKDLVEAVPPERTSECTPPPPPDVASVDAKVVNSDSPNRETSLKREDFDKDTSSTDISSTMEKLEEPDVIQDLDLSTANECPFSLDDEASNSIKTGELSLEPMPTKQEPEDGKGVQVEGKLNNVKAEAIERQDSLASSKPPTPIRKPIFKTEHSIKIGEEEDFIENDDAEFMDEEQGENVWDDEIEDPDEEMGEEGVNRRYMEDNVSEADDELQSALEDVKVVKTEPTGMNYEEEVICPICSVALKGIKNDDATRHVNACLDGKPIPLPSPVKVEITKSNKEPRKVIVRPERPPQASPFTAATPNIPSNGSAFSMIMASHAEDRAWASAAQAENAARGKRSFERTCPFYKILPNLNIAVDAFRYGAVAGTNAYFLSHFHSDHYIGLGANWCHGPIYCSRVTANLCRRQLRVDPRWMMELDYEVKTEVPGTGGATVTMIDANHCPGSSLFLYEKDIPNGRGGTKKQRILHCGDFRAHAKHLRHPLLSVLQGNKIDICYLDTTYLNPKYAFPTQQQVIDVCAELCVSMSKEIADSEDTFEKTRRERGITGFLKGGDDHTQQSTEIISEGKNRGKLLIVVGTYSIGKERICMGIAKALNCKIFAPPNKQKICAALENPELSERLTNDPYVGQVHMTPLMEIRAETLKDYLQNYKPRFSRIVGFRPSGWNYRPPNSRFIESPTVTTVLNAPAWRSDYHISQMYPQRGSCTEAKCYGVPYSEHSSFRELTSFCCALDIVKIIPTVNVGSAKSREKMKVWFEKWAAEKKKNGFWKIEEGREVL